MLHLSTRDLAKEIAKESSKEIVFTLKINTIKTYK